MADGLGDCMMTTARDPQQHRGDVRAVQAIADLDEPSLYDRLWQPCIAHPGGDRLQRTA